MTPALRGLLAPRWPRSRPPWSYRVLALVALVTLAGCATPPPAPALLYLPGDAPVGAGRQAAATPADSASSEGLWRLVTPIALPAALDREAVMVASAPGQWLPWQGLRWAEPLREAVQRVLVVDLAALRGGTVWPGRLAPGMVAERELRIDIDEWEAALTPGEVRLRARWTLSVPGGREPALRGAVRVREPWVVATPTALVNAQRAALRGLAQAVADQTARALAQASSTPAARLGVQQPGAR